MAPAIAEVKDEAELIAWADRLGHLHGVMVLDDSVILERLRVNKPDASAIRQLKLVQMRKIPPRKRLVDRVR